MKNMKFAGSMLMVPPTPARPRRRLQFTLLTFLCTITVLGGILGKWFYYRPLTVVVDAQFVFASRMAVDEIIAKHDLHRIDNSPFSWMVVAEEELPQLLKSGTNAAIPARATAKHLVPFWPSTAFTGTYAHADFVRLSPGENFPVHEMGSIGGFIGSRIAGIDRQFCVDCNVSLEHPNYAAVREGRFDEIHRLKGRLFYDGTMPDGHLVFLAPLGDDEYSVIVFDINH